MSSHSEKGNYNQNFVSYIKNKKQILLRVQCPYFVDWGLIKSCHAQNVVHVLDTETIFGIPDAILRTPNTHQHCNIAMDLNMLNFECVDFKYIELCVEYSVQHVQIAPNCVFTRGVGLTALLLRTMWTRRQIIICQIVNALHRSWSIEFYYKIQKLDKG